MTGLIALLLCMGIALSWAARSRPGARWLLRLSGALLILALSLLGIMLPGAMRFAIGD